MLRLLLGLPRYLERLLTRLEGEDRLDSAALTRVYADVALFATIAVRFLSGGEEAGPGVRMAGFHLNKLVLRTLTALLHRRVEPGYVERYVEGAVDPVNPTDDLSESGFFHTMESGEAGAVNRTVLRLTERAFYRWLEDVCLDEANQAFEVEDSPFDDRETEVLRAIHADGGPKIERGRELVPFLRRAGNRDCRRVLSKLEAWFLRQYDVYHAAAVIHHAANLQRGVADADRVLSRHTTGNYLGAIALLAAPFAAAAVAYERAPRVFDWLCAAELMLADAAVLWFLLYRFCWKRDLTFFHSSVPRIGAGIIVGYLPIFFIDEMWYLAQESWITLFTVVLLLAFTTLLYLYVEVQRRLGAADEAFARARQIFVLGVLQAFGIGLIITGLIGRFMAERNWEGSSPLGGLGESAPAFIGQLPVMLGVDPFYAFPPAVFLMTFLSFFIGTFLQLMWEDIPITEPL